MKKIFFSFLFISTGIVYTQVQQFEDIYQMGPHFEYLPQFADDYISYKNKKITLIKSITEVKNDKGRLDGENYTYTSQIRKIAHHKRRIEIDTYYDDSPKECDRYTWEFSADGQLSACLHSYIDHNKKTSYHHFIYNYKNGILNSACKIDNETHKAYLCDSIQYKNNRLHRVSSFRYTLLNEKDTAWVYHLHDYFTYRGDTTIIDNGFTENRPHNRLVLVKGYLIAATQYKNYPVTKFNWKYEYDFNEKTPRLLKTFEFNEDQLQGTETYFYKDGLLDRIETQYTDHFLYHNATSITQLHYTFSKQ